MLCKSLQKSIGWSQLHVEIEGEENIFFHFKNFLGRVILVTDVDVIFQKGWVYFLILCCDEHGCQGYQLDFSWLDLSLAEVPVDDVDGQEQTLRQKLEIVMDLEKPVDQGWPNGFVDFKLKVHVVEINRPVLLNSKHVLLNTLTEFRHVVNRVQSLSIHLWQCLKDKSFASVLEHLQFLLERDFGKFLCSSTLESLFLFDGAIHR